MNKLEKLDVEEFTKEDVFSTCIDRVFEKNCIKHMSLKSQWEPDPHESFFEIKGKQIKISKANKIQNSVRFDFLCDLLKFTISNYDLDLDCFIIFNLTDGIDPREYYTRICFSAPLDSNHILMPDPHIFHHIMTVDQNLEGDPAFEDKEDLVVFYGSDAGLVGGDLLNQRVKFCFKSVNNKYVKAKIANFIHFSEDMLKDLGISLKSIETDRVSIKDQLKSKYILNIDGNGSSWDRTPWAMASNSYLIHLKSDNNTNVNWYYPFIEKLNLLPIFSEEDILNGKIQLNHNTKSKQKAFSEILLDKGTQLEYFARVLVKYNKIFNR